MSATMSRLHIERSPRRYLIPAQRQHQPGARLESGQLTWPEFLAFLKTIAARYRQCFPEDAFWQALPVTDASEETLMDVATTFLETVDSRLFPVHTELFIDELAEAWLIAPTCRLSGKRSLGATRNGPFPQSWISRPFGRSWPKVRSAVAPA